MGYRKFFYILKSKLWFIILVTVINSNISAYISIYVTEPEYESVAYLYIMSKSNSEKNVITYDSILVSKQLTKDYSELIKGNEILKAVIKELNLNTTVDSLTEKLSVGIVNDTNILQIKVRDKDPAAAYQITLMTSTIFIKSIRDLTSEDNISMFGEPKTSTKPISPKTTMNIVLTFISSFAGCLCIVFLYDYLDNSVKTEEDAEKYTGLKVLGTLPNVMFLKPVAINKPGVKFLFESDSCSKFYIEEAYNTIRTNIFFQTAEREVKTFIIASTDSGEGRTTITVNMAVSMAKKGLRVLLVDADFRKNNSRHFNKDNYFTPGLSNYIVKTFSFSEIIYKTNYNGIDYTPAGYVLSNPAEKLSSIEFNSFIDEAEHNYDILVIDTSPVSRVIDCIEVSAGRRAVIFVIQAGRVESIRVKKAAAMLKNANAGIIGIILNRVKNKFIYEDFTYICKVFVNKYKAFIGKSGSYIHKFISGFITKSKIIGKFVINSAGRIISIYISKFKSKLNYTKISLWRKHER